LCIACAQCISWIPSSSRTHQNLFLDAWCVVAALRPCHAVLTLVMALFSVLQAALSAMMLLELPHVNVLTKMNLLEEHHTSKVDECVRHCVIILMCAYLGF